MCAGALDVERLIRTFTQAGRFFITYLRPSSSRSVKSLTQFAKRALLHAFKPAGVTPRWLGCCPYRDRHPKPVREGCSTRVIWSPNMYTEELQREDFTSV